MTTTTTDVSMSMAFVLFLLMMSYAIIIVRCNAEPLPSLSFESEDARPPHVACHANFGFMNVDAIRSAFHPYRWTHNPIKGPIKAVVYTDGVKYVCPDPKNEVMVKAHQMAVAENRYAVAHVFYLTDSEYDNDAFWQCGKSPATARWEEQRQAARRDADKIHVKDSFVIFPPTITREQALIDLWFGVRPLDFCFLQSHHGPSLDDAERQFRYGTWVDYFFRKPIKTDFATFPALRSNMYDRDAGEGAMAAVAARTGPRYDGTTQMVDAKSPQTNPPRYDGGIKLIAAEPEARRIGNDNVAKRDRSITMHAEQPKTKKEDADKSLVVAACKRWQKHKQTDGGK